MSDASDKLTSGHVRTYASAIKDYVVPVIVAMVLAAITYASVIARLDRLEDEVRGRDAAASSLRSDHDQLRNEVTGWRAGSDEKIRALEESLRDLKAQMEKGFDRIADKIDKLQSGGTR